LGFFRNRFEKFVRGVIADHFPHLADRVHVVGQNQSRNTGFSSAGYESYNESVWIHKAVTVWENLFSPLPLLIWDDAENSESKRHFRLKALLESPNEETASCDFWGRMIQDIGLRGEHFFETSFDPSGRLLQFNQIPPQNVNVILSTNGKNRLWETIKGYNIDASFPSSSVRLNYNLNPEQMVFFRRRNPKVNVAPRGISPVGALRQPVLTDLHGREWNLNFMKNAARPDVIAVVPQGITKKEKEHLKKEIADDYNASSGGTGKILVLEQGLVDFKDWTSTQKDIQWTELLKLTREEIGAAYGLPPEFMGFGNSTFDNLDRAELLVYTGTIMPLAKQRDDRLTHYLRMIGELTNRFRVVTDFTVVEGLRRLFNTKFRQAQSLFGMGVPFFKLDEHFNLGIGRFPGDDLSHPFGSTISFDQTGDPIDEEDDLNTTAPEGGNESSEEKK